jgi:hypothetical protein
VCGANQTSISRAFQEAVEATNAERAAIGRRGKRIAETFCAQAVAERVCAVYRKILNDPRS